MCHDGGTPDLAARGAARANAFGACAGLCTRASRGPKRLEQGARLRQGFLVFALGVRVGHDAAAYVEISATPLQEKGTDEDVEIGTAVETEIAGGAGVDAAAHRFQRIDDLHAADLGDPGDAGPRKHRRQEVEGVAIATQAADDVADQVADMRIALDVHEALDFDTAELAYAPDVVARHVDDHEMLGALLLARQQLALQRPVGSARIAARARARDGSCRHAVAFELEQALRRTAHQHVVRESHVGGEWRRVDRAQPAVEIETVAGIAGLEAVRQVGLIDVAIQDVCMCSRQHRIVRFAIEVAVQRRDHRRPRARRLALAALR